MKAFRLNRLFAAASRRCLAIAVGHGLDDPDRCVRTLAAAAPDVLQLSIGQAALLQFIPGKNKPALILRADVTNVHGPALPPAPFSRMIGNAVEQAVRLDAAGVVVSLLHIPGEPALTAQCVENIARLKPDCERFALPLIIEPLVIRASAQADGDWKKILPLIRHACELGADLIQTEPPDEVADFHHVVESAGRIPMLVRADSAAPDAKICDRAEKLIQQGVAGLVYGRDFIQHANPSVLTRALMSIVHDGATAADAVRFIG